MMGVSSEVVTTVIPLSTPTTITTTTINTPPSLLSLPTELHLLLSTYLSYPDALSLKHTHRHFYHIIDTGVRLKVSWLLERKRLSLPLPNDQRLFFKSDAEFTEGRVRRLMERWRWHLECGGERGCVVGSTICEVKEVGGLGGWFVRTWRGCDTGAVAAWAALGGLLVAIVVRLLLR